MEFKNSIILIKLLIVQCLLVCCLARGFDFFYFVQQVSDLISSLQTSWPTLACPSGNGVSFWSHEWDKHGTCSESMFDQHGYFQLHGSQLKRTNRPTSNSSGDRN
ncbi:hypothetical protein RHMOL_Rhmol07G0303300 [Rhododendron molle]|uniref:Uncharacterized protein n=1 Tax=Rhododendron molle TaxID=49168 RepID=A0ACC0N7V1_RHOML|nr:hypothetical protein RHMOL_Rhmol07G0303300 [Rhododendron molle]